jgi:hypothetical protein
VQARGYLEQSLGDLLLCLDADRLVVEESCPIQSRPLCFLLYPTGFHYYLLPFLNLAFAIMIDKFILVEYIFAFPTSEHANVI